MIGGVTDAPAEQAAARRNERELDHIPLWAGRERQRPGGENPAVGLIVLRKASIFVVYDFQESGHKGGVSGDDGRQGAFQEPGGDYPGPEG